ncbi:hypothetical protein LZK73_31660 (plasmid) [Neorhizobium galegae]|nr:hypothetical protein LZK73_31660 [Neorhizobium galegae]
MIRIGPGRFEPVGDLDLFGRQFCRAILAPVVIDCMQSRLYISLPIVRRKRAGARLVHRINDAHCVAIGDIFQLPHGKDTIGNNRICKFVFLFKGVESKACHRNECDSDDGKAGKQFRFLWTY